MPFLGGYAIKFAVSFGAVSAFSAYLMTSLALVDEGWDGLWMCIGSASFIVGYSLSYWLVERKTECANSRLVLVGSLIAVLSHWLSWYGFLLVNYVQWKFFGKALDFDPIDPVMGLGVAWGYSLFSLAFLGWLSLPLAIFLSFNLQRP